MYLFIEWILYIGYYKSTMSFSKTQIVLIVIILPLFVSGCAQLKSLDQKVGEIFFNGASSTSETIKENNIDGFNVAPPDASDLTPEQKEKIEKWLNDNNLNRYGDALDIFYAGGTPLFDEASGKSIERFEYILKKHPDILNKIKN